MPKRRELRYEDRQLIEKRLKEGKRIVEVAAELGMHRDTIYRELGRVNASRNHKLYDATAAQLTV